MKILIVKLSSIGDVIHTIPVLPAIKRALPRAEISWIVEKGSAEILRNNPLISNLVEIDTRGLRKKKTFRTHLPEISRQLRALRDKNFDIALDFQGLLKSSTIARLAGAERRFGFAREALREPASRFFLTETVAVPENIHIVGKNLALVEKSLNIPVPHENFEFPIFSEARHIAEAEEIISNAGADFAIINPATGWITKTWDARKYGQLADQMWEHHGLKTIVTTAPSEKPLAEKVLESSKSGKVIAVAPSLKGFYELAKRTKIYIGGDTGPTFLAVAAKAPIVGIYGPTEWWRNGSPHRDDICVERTDIECRVNCHRRTCSNWICLDISVEKVLMAVSERLHRAQNIEVTFG